MFGSMLVLMLAVQAPVDSSGPAAVASAVMSSSSASSAMGSSASLAPAAQEPKVDVTKTASDKLMKMLKMAVDNKMWGLAAAIALMLLVMGLRKLKPDMIPPEYTPYLALVLAAGPTVALALSGAVPYDDLVATFVTIWLTSGGAWSNPKHIVESATAFLNARKESKPEESKPEVPPETK